MRINYEATRVSVQSYGGPTNAGAYPPAQTTVNYGVNANYYGQLVGVGSNLASGWGGYLGGNYHPGFGANPNPQHPGFLTNPNSRHPGFLTGGLSGNTHPGFLTNPNAQHPGFLTNPRHAHPGFLTNPHSQHPGFLTNPAHAHPGFLTNPNSSHPGFLTNPRGAHPGFLTNPSAQHPGFVHAGPLPDMFGVPNYTGGFSAGSLFGFQDSSYLAAQRANHPALHPGMQINYPFPMF